MPWLLSKTAYQQLRQNSQVLEADIYGEKVLLKNYKIIKLFRTKSWFSSAIIYPYAWRFVKNASQLKKLNIPTVDIENQFYCYAIRRHGVIYALLEGIALSDLLTQNKPNIYQQLAQFIATLHDLGVYFRSLHPGNILLLPDGQFGLIDIADMQFKKPLSLSQRQRNFCHLFRYKQYHQGFNNFGWHQFFTLYNQSTEKKCFKAEKFINNLQNKRLIRL